jgi:hypothetical protein
MRQGSRSARAAGLAKARAVNLHAILTKAAAPDAARKADHAAPAEEIAEKRSTGRLRIRHSANLTEEAHHDPVSRFIAGEHLRIGIDFTVQQGVAHCIERFQKAGQ